MKRSRRPGPSVTMPSGFTGFGLPPEAILLVVRWYLRSGAGLLREPQPRPRDCPALRTTNRIDRSLSG